MTHCDNCGKEISGWMRLCGECRKAEIEMRKIYEQMSPEVREKHRSKTPSEIDALAKEVVRRWKNK